MGRQQERHGSRLQEGTIEVRPVGAGSHDAFGLDAADDRLDELVAKVRVFSTEVLEVPATVRHASHADLGQARSRESSAGARSTCPHWTLRWSAAGGWHRRWLGRTPGPSWTFAPFP